jgi:hypothetical protein
MRKKFLLFTFIILFGFSSSSSNTDIGGLRGAYLEYCIHPTPENYKQFKEENSDQFILFPLDWVKTLDDNQSDWKFTYVCLKSLINWEKFLDPKSITHDKYPKLLNLIADRIRREFIRLWSRTQSFEVGLEVNSILINLAQKTFFKLKSQGMEESLPFKDFDEQIEIWKFLMIEIPRIFINSTVEYNFLFNIMDHLKSNRLYDSLIHPRPLAFSKCFTLFVMYLYHLRKNKDTNIFRYYNPQSPIVLYLVLQLEKDFIGNPFYLFQDFFSKVEQRLKELYDDKGAINLDCLAKIVEDFNYKKLYYKHTGMETSMSYDEMIQFFNFFSRPHRWDLLALSKIENFLSQKPQNSI